MAEPITPEALISELQRISAQQPQTTEGLRALEDASTALLLRLRDSPSLEFPEIIWHFLSDADVRFKDPRYGSAQRLGLSEALLRIRRASSS